jgi:hypothetical protein
MSEKLSRYKAYPLAREIGVNQPPDVKAMWTGEKRKPKKGEWFLSGSIIEAYKAHNDLNTKYYSAYLVCVKKTETYTPFKE